MFKLGVDPPWYRDSEIERMAFNLYAMEIEGYFNTEVELENATEDEFNQQE